LKQGGGYRKDPNDQYRERNAPTCKFIEDVNKKKSFSRTNGKKLHRSFMVPMLRKKDLN